MPVAHIMSYCSKPKKESSFDGEGENFKTEDNSATEFSRPAHQGMGSEEVKAVVRLEERSVDNMLAFLHPVGESSAEPDPLLQERLQAIQEAHRQQLCETGLLLQQELDRRVLRNSLMATGIERGARANGHPDSLLPSSGKQHISTDANSKAPRCGGLGRSCSLSDLNSPKAAVSSTLPFQQKSNKPVTAPASGAPGTTIPRPFRMMLREDLRRSQLLQTKVPQDIEMLLESKRKMEEMECQKKFHASPVPGHVFVPLYHKIVDAQMEARKAGLAQRRDFLLSMQKPFSFLVREEKKREEDKGNGTEGPALKGDMKSVKESRPIPKAVMDPNVSERLKEEELHRKIRIQMRAQEMLKSSTAPIEMRPNMENLQIRCAQKTKSQVLSFLNEKPSFQPRTNARVPDFNRLHWVFQKEAERRAERKDVTRCQPFQLRTSALPPRQSRKNQETAGAPVVKTRLKRSQSLGGITSLSIDTLPVYITDAARRRGSAIRSSMVDKESKMQESAEWLKEYRVKSEAMRKTVTSRARAMDTHRSLKEVFQEKLKQNREMDSQRMKEYRNELREMKTRVKVRPYLFEQVTQRNARSDAEKRYRDTLLQAGLDEQFVRAKGEEPRDEDDRSTGDSVSQCREDTKETEGNLKSQE